MPAISELTTANSVNSTDLVPVVQTAGAADNPKKATISQVVTAVLADPSTQAAFNAKANTTSPTISNPTFTGTPIAPTAAVDTSTTQIATTAFVMNEEFSKNTYYATGGTGTAYTITPAPAISAYTVGKSFLVKFTAASGNDPTLTINGVASPPTLMKLNPDGSLSNIKANDIPAGHMSYVMLTSTTQAVVASIPQSKLVNGTAVSTTSGTSVDFTSIPSWVKKITVSFSGLSTNGTSSPIIQLGTNSGPETTSYAGTVAQAATTPSIAILANSSGFLFNGAHAATAVYHGTAVLTLLDQATNLWSYMVISGRSDSATTCGWGGGSKALSSTLTRVRITTLNGTDTFDAGQINILYEG